MAERITVEVLVNAPSQKVWHCWTEPGHITAWCSPSDDWHAPRAENDLRVGGKFMTRMEARDGSAGFDFGGTYTAVEEAKLIEYTMDDGRTVRIEFSEEGGGCRVIEAFDPEDENPREVQQSGWQAILENFKKHVEAEA